MNCLPILYVSVRHEAAYFVPQRVLLFQTLNVRVDVCGRSFSHMQHCAGKIMSEWKCLSDEFAYILVSLFHSLISSDAKPCGLDFSVDLLSEFDVSQALSCE